MIPKVDEDKGGNIVTASVTDKCTTGKKGDRGAGGGGASGS